MTDITAIDILTGIQDFFKDHRWVKNNAYVSKNGEPIGFLLETPETMGNIAGACMIGALDYSLVKLTGHYDRELFNEANNALNRHLEELDPKPFSTVSWNDKVAQSKEDVIEFVEESKKLVLTEDPGEE